MPKIIDKNALEQARRAFLASGGKLSAQQVSALSGVAMRTAHRHRQAWLQELAQAQPPDDQPAPADDPPAAKRALARAVAVTALGEVSSRLKDREKLNPRSLAELMGAARVASDIFETNLEPDQAGPTGLQALLSLAADRILGDDPPPQAAEEGGSGFYNPN